MQKWIIILLIFSSCTCKIAEPQYYHAKLNVRKGKVIKVDSYICLTDTSIQINNSNFKVVSFSHTRDRSIYHTRHLYFIHIRGQIGVYDHFGDRKCVMTNIVKL